MRKFVALGLVLLVLIAAPALGLALALDHSGSAQPVTVSAGPISSISTAHHGDWFYSTPARPAPARSTIRHVPVRTERHLIRNAPRLAIVVRHVAPPAPVYHPAPRPVWHPAPRPVWHPAPRPVYRPVPLASYCGRALAYLAAHAKPGAVLVCDPIGSGNGIAATTWLYYTHTTVVAERIVIYLPSCPVAYENEASNSWFDAAHSKVYIGAHDDHGRVWDPFGEC